MPFNFSGDKPALQPTHGSPTPFSSFASFGSSTSSSFASMQPRAGAWTPNINNFPVPSSSSQHRVAQSGGSASKMISSRANIVTEEARILANAPPSDTLSHGLHRLLTGRPAPFGDREREVDRTLQQYLSEVGGSKEEGRQLIAQGLRDMRLSGENPAMKRLMSFLLEKLLCSEKEPVEYRRVSPPSMADMFGLPKEGRKLEGPSRAGVKDQPEEETHDAPARLSTGGPGPGGEVIRMPSSSPARQESASTPEHDGLGDRVDSFPFMDLPPELRLPVYRDLLAPTGFIEDHDHNNDYTAILRTSKQIYHEAHAILYDENIFYFSMHIRLGTNPMLEHSYFPNNRLHVLQKAVMVLDLTHIHGTTNDIFDKVDWRTVQSMVKLKEVRLCCVDDRRSHGGESWIAAMMVRLVERLPTACVVTYGVVSDRDRFAQKQVMDAASYKNDRDPFVVDEALLERCGRLVEGRQGVESGHTRDYRYPEKQEFVLEPLIAGGEESAGDDSIVLGR